MNAFEACGLRGRGLAPVLALTGVLIFGAGHAVAQTLVKTGVDLTTQSTTDTQVGRTARYAVSLGLPAGQTAAVVDVTDAIPAGMEYVADSLKLPSNAVGSWSINNGASYVGVEPTPASSVTNLRITGSSYMAATSAMGTLPTPAAASASGGTGGDGYRAIPYNGKVYSIYHHASWDALYCGDQATGVACPGFPTSVPQASGAAFATNPWYTTSLITAEYLDRNSGRLYFWVLDSASSKPAVVCADLKSNTSCGSYTYTSAAAYLYPGNFFTLTGGQQGSRLYANAESGRMRCFDTATFGPCAGTDAAGTFAVAGAPTDTFNSQNEGLLQVGSRLYWQAIGQTNTTPQLVCFDMQTSAACAGFTSVVLTNGGGFMPTADAAGTTNGFCLGRVSGTACYDLNGVDVTASKTEFVTYVDQNPLPGITWGYGALGASVLAAGPNVPNSRSFWQTDNGNKKLCWDWVTDAACTGYDSTLGYGYGFYESTIDPANPTCVWSLGDGGTLGATSSIDGGPCKVEVKTLVLASPDGNFCDGKPHATTWSRIALEGLQESDYGSARVTIRDASNNILPGWNATTVTFPVDLSAYPTSGATASLSVEVELLGITNVTPFNSNPQPYISVQWNGDPQQVCYSAKLVCGSAPVTTVTNTASGLIAGVSVTGSHTFNNVDQTCWNPNAPTEIAVTKTSSTAGPVAAGGSVDYVVTLSNVGTMFVPQVHLTDSFPAGLKSASWTCSASGGTPAQACIAPSGNAVAPNPILDQSMGLQAGGTVTYHITAVAGSAAVMSTANTVTATVSGGSACSKDGPQEASCSATTRAGQPPVVGDDPKEITLIKTSSTAGPLVAGGTVDYVVTVSNVGTVIVPQVHLTDSFPAGLKSANWTCSASGGTPVQTCNAPSGNAVMPNLLLDQIQDLQPGGVLTYRISAVAGGTAVTSTANTVTATVPGGVACTKGGLQTASCSATTSGAQPPDLGSNVASVPSLSQWALMLLAIVLAGFAAINLRRS